MDRVILHCDLNNFYASVECLYNPEIRDKPVAVCGSQEDRHGIVLAKNCIAKKYGVQTGETIWQSKLKCPDLLVVPPRYHLYQHFSKLTRKIYERYTDQIESFGIDECWLDVTGSTRLFGSGERIAEEIRQTVKRELGLTLSIGVSFNKIFAKLGSDLQKPDAVTVISRNNYKNLVWPLPAGSLLYVGPATRRRLARIGIETIGQLAAASPELLSCQLGKWGEILWAFANGLDTSPVLKVDFQHPIKSIGNSITTRVDLKNDEEVKKTFYVLAESVAERLRKHNFKGFTVGIWVRDNSFYSETRQTKLESPTFLSTEIADKALELFKKNYDWQKRKPIRSLGIRMSDLVVADTAIQLSFYDDVEKNIKMESLEKSIDKIRQRFGSYAIQRAILLKEKNITKNSLVEDVSSFSYFR
ncbi:MAG TPA: DNA polymerase IV [Clostridia bacterium]|nr:DNA polymerase IV [Clostridia bacterium]